MRALVDSVIESVDFTFKNTLPEDIGNLIMTGKLVVLHNGLPIVESKLLWLLCEEPATLRCPLNIPVKAGDSVGANLEFTAPPTVRAPVTIVGGMNLTGCFEV